MKWSLAWDGDKYVVRDEDGKYVASCREKRMAVEWALAEAVKRQQSVEIVESRDCMRGGESSAFFAVFLGEKKNFADFQKKWITHLAMVEEV